MTINPKHCPDCHTAYSIMCVADTLIESSLVPLCHPHEVRDILLAAFNHLEQGACTSAVDKMKEVAARFTV